MKDQPSSHTLQELKKNKEFICPHCGSVNPIKDAITVEVLVEETSHMTFHGSHYQDHISSTFTKIRFCKNCRNVRLRNKIFRHVSYFTLLPFILIALTCIITWTWKIYNPWGLYFFYLMILFFLYVPAVKFFREFISPKFNKLLIKKAIEGNAIE